MVQSLKKSEDTFGHGLTLLTDSLRLNPFKGMEHAQ